ncbi:MAG: hypothetical protein IJR32_03545 [Paludibacteraceae bacterium]|nr:hypothetical protein [Paludibacteraceae bacterium]
MKTFILLLIAALALTLISCKSGCGCPGNAGYPSDNINAPITMEKSNA